MAIHARSGEIGRTYQTIVDGLRRRLALSDITEFHRLVARWVGDGAELDMWSAGLRRRLRGRYQGDSTAEVRADRER